MKKIVSCFVFLFLLLSCDNHNWDDTVITNSSAEEITFKFSNTGKQLLAPGGTTTFPTNAYQHLESYSPAKRVFFEYEPTNDGYTGEFKQLDSMPVKVNNTLNKIVRLTADGWMDEMVIPANNSTQTGTIYTSSPVFKAVVDVPDFFISTTWEINDDVMWVKIYN